MLRDIIDRFTGELAQAGVPQVYSAFDAVDIKRKSGGIFTVVSVDAFSSTAPVWSLYHIYIPFRAEVSLKVTSPQDWPMDRLLDWYDSNIAPVLLGMSGMDCKLKSLTIKPDTNINRLVLTAVMSAGGVIRSERSVT